MTVDELKGQTVGFAASGGLDSCTVTRWLTEQGVRVVALCADMAQPDETDFATVGERMRASGAVEFVAVPMHERIAAAGIEGVQFQARYEGAYWNTTGIGRHVIVAGLMPELASRGITILGHGATGRGNDQVRFQLCTNMLAPKVSVYAPWRDPKFLAAFRGRSEMIAYCQKHNLPVKATLAAPYSTDANLLGLTHEAGKLEHLTESPWFVTPGMGVKPVDAPETPEVVSIRFEQGVPVTLNSEALSPFEILRAGNAIGGKHAIGICTHLVENRFVGIKSRGVYEAPGMELLGRAYQFLLELVLDRRARELFDHLGPFLARQIYQGYGFDAASHMARAAMQPVLALATGTIEVMLYKGQASFHAAADVPHQLYSESNASMEAIGEFDHADSEGFLRVLQVSARGLASAGQVVVPDWAR